MCAIELETHVRLSTERHEVVYRALWDVIPVMRSCQFRSMIAAEHVLLVQL